MKSVMKAVFLLLLMVSPAAAPVLIPPYYIQVNGTTFYDWLKIANGPNVTIATDVPNKTIKIDALGSGGGNVTNYNNYTYINGSVKNVTASSPLNAVNNSGNITIFDNRTTYPNDTVAGNLANWNNTYNSTYDLTTSTVNGNLNNWNATYNATYNAKEPAITAGSPPQFLGWDKIMRTIYSDNITETTSLFFTSARVRNNISNATSRNLTYSPTTGTFDLLLTTCTGNNFYQSIYGKNISCVAGSSDPWTYVKLTSNFSTTSATAVNVGLNFTPVANQKYDIEAKFLLRTATATVEPRPGNAWSSGLIDGVSEVRVTNGAAAEVLQFCNIAAACLAPVGGLPTTTGSWPGELWATIQVGASPSGLFEIQLASETAGTSVTMVKGSFLKYRTY